MSDRPISEAIILAGGKGSRLRSVVADRPKPLAWVAGRPFISYLLDQLESAGVIHCVIATGHMGGEFERRLGCRYGTMDLTYSHETMPLGTGGGLKLSLNRTRGDAPVFVLNGDSFCECDLVCMASAHRSAGRTMTMALMRGSGSGRFGGVQCDASGSVVAFGEREDSRPLFNAGVYLLNPGALTDVRLDADVSLEREIFPVWAANGCLHGFEVFGRFIDIGIPESLYLARRIFQAEVVFPGQWTNPSDGPASHSTDGDALGPSTVVVVVRSVQGGILLRKLPEDPLWSLPAGCQVSSESAAGSAARIVLSQTGLAISVERVVGVYGGRQSSGSGCAITSPRVVLEASVLSGDRQGGTTDDSFRFFSPAGLPANTVCRAQEYLMDCLNSADTVCR